MVQPHPRESAISRFRGLITPLVVVFCLGSVVLQACNALPHGRPALAPIGGTTQEVPLAWDGLDKRLQPALNPLHLRVYIVERPDPDWIQAELLDLAGRSVS